MDDADVAAAAAAAAEADDAVVVAAGVRDAADETVVTVVGTLVGIAASGGAGDEVSIDVGPFNCASDALSATAAVFCNESFPMVSIPILSFAVVSAEIFPVAPFKGVWLMDLFICSTGVGVPAFDELPVDCVGVAGAFCIVTVSVPGEAAWIDVGEAIAIVPPPAAAAAAATTTAFAAFIFSNICWC